MKKTIISIIKWNEKNRKKYWGEKTPNVRNALGLSKKE